MDFPSSLAFSKEESERLVQAPSWLSSWLLSPEKDLPDQLGRSVPLSVFGPELTWFSE